MSHPVQRNIARRLDTYSPEQSMEQYWRVQYLSNDNNNYSYSNNSNNRNCTEIVINNKQNIINSNNTTT